LVRQQRGVVVMCGPVRVGEQSGRGKVRRPVQGRERLTEIRMMARTSAFSAWYSALRAANLSRVCWRAGSSRPLTKNSTKLVRLR
jgi:hypothetical protein